MHSIERRRCSIVCSSALRRCTSPLVRFCCARGGATLARGVVRRGRGAVFSSTIRGSTYSRPRRAWPARGSTGGLASVRVMATPPLGWRSTSAGTYHLLRCTVRRVDFTELSRLPASSEHTAGLAVRTLLPDPPSARAAPCARPAPHGIALRAGARDGKSLSSMPSRNAFACVEQVSSGRRWRSGQRADAHAKFQRAVRG